MPILQLIFHRKTKKFRMYMSLSGGIKTFERVSVLKKQYFYKKVHILVKNRRV